MGLLECGIQDDKLPQCWSDDVRMNALFAPFRLKTANPESWDMKMKFWSDMLRQWCRLSMDPLVSAADAKVVFQRRGRAPACLDIVVEEMFHNGELSPISKYQQILHNGPEGWVRWGARLAFKPAAFAITAVTSLLPARQALDSDGLPKASIDSTQRFVLESAVKEQATKLLQNYPVGIERIGTIDELMRNCDYPRSRESFELLLGWLVAQGYAIKKGDVVKIAELDKKATPVSDTDEAVVKLTSAERRLEIDETRLLRDVTAAESDARAALQLGNKLQAKNHLRRKHKINQRLERCSNALENVRQLLQQMRDVHDNAAIVDTYRTGSEAMKRGMKDTGLDEDGVLDTMDDLKEVMDSYNEVEKALATNVEDFDAAELEQELKDLLAAGGGGGGGVTPGKRGREVSKSTPQSGRSTKKLYEREFVFDGEERMLAELNDLDIEDGSPKGEGKEERGEETKEGKKKVPVAEGWEDDKPATPKPKKPSKSWYPPSEECLRSDGTWSNNNTDVSLKDIAKEYGELRQDERLHPGQALKVDFSTPPRLYNTDFQVRDHKMESGVWLYNSRDGNSNVETDLAHSTEYFSSESPGKSSGHFQMAPGGERRKTLKSDEEAVVEDLERRLKTLRGLDL